MIRGWGQREVSTCDLNFLPAQRRVHPYFFISFIKCEVEGRKKEWVFKAVSSPIKDGVRVYYIGAALFLGMLLGIKVLNAITRQSLILAFSSFHLPTRLCLTNWFKASLLFLQTQSQNGSLEVSFQSPRHLYSSILQYRAIAQMTWLEF